jgi:four helix bundle protein
MATITRFEDIQAWQEARILTRRVYEHTSRGEWSRDFGLRDQIRRASVSIASNIAEGFDRKGNGDFHRFLAIAKGSAAEVKTQLYIALDLNYLSQEDFEALHSLTDKVARMLGSLMSYLASTTSARANSPTRKRANAPTRKPVNP